MIPLVDTSPDFDAQPAEYNRLLGYPRDWTLSDRAAELAEQAREWYARNGRPWIYARQVEDLEIADASVRIDGSMFHGERLRSTLAQAEAHSAVLVAVSAGPELEQEAQRLWTEEKPDEYFFLEVFGSAVVEHLTTMTGARLCAWADTQAMAVLPHYSPGYPEWSISEQPRLLDLLRPAALPGPIESLDSGALRPRKSLLAVFGVTHHTDRVRRLTDLVPCENCSYGGCAYRRAPYVRATRRSPDGLVGLNPAVEYSVNAKALRRWSSERLKLEFRGDGAVDVLFRYDGTTCSNMGRPLAFHYRVKLGPPAEGYPILEQNCTPAPGDTGHVHMCQYLKEPQGLMSAIDQEKPLLGRPLDEVLTWRRAACPTGCYCEPEARAHKWGLVLETIHYALTEKENEK